MNKILLLVLSLLSVSSKGQDTTRVLFIGNSFTNVHNIPSLVSGLAAKAGLPFAYHMHAPDGMTVGDTSQGTNAHMNNPVVFDQIRKGNWNYVSLQDNQGRFVFGSGTFPDTNVSKVIRGHLKIRDSVKAHNPCAHLLWFSGWAWKNGYPGISTTAQGLIQNIYQNYQYLKDTAGGVIAPIGISWERAMTAVPGTNLWGPDDTHQSLAGAYLSASVIFTSIFKINTELVFYDGGLDAATARELRRIAYSVVMDSITTTDLALITPVLTVTPTLLAATPGYISYQWFQNGVAIGSGAANSFSITSEGCYYVEATDNNGCQSRSFTHCPATTVENTVADLLIVYPIPASNKINIIYNSGSIPYYISICDAMGRSVFEGNANSCSHTVDTRDIPAGAYVLKLNNGSQVYHRSIVIVK